VPTHGSADENEYEYIYCGDTFVNPLPEAWVQCSLCFNRYHEACVLHMKPPLPAVTASQSVNVAGLVTAYFVSFASDVQELMTLVTILVLLLKLINNGVHILIAAR